MRVAPVLLLHARALLPGTPLRATSVRMGWSDPDWKWGWGNGAAHDEAARMRAKLSTAPSRESFLFEVFAGVADVEDVKMALALKCQRARNRRYDDNGRWEALMDEMADCRFEGDGGQDALCAALRERLGEKAPPAPAAGSAGSGVQQLPILAAAAFKALDFVEKGL